MQIIVQDTIGNRQAGPFTFEGGVRIGSDEECEIHLNSRMVSRIHARLDRAEGGWTLQVADGKSSLIIDGDELVGGQSRLIKGVTHAELNEFVIIFDDEPKQQAAPTYERELNDLQTALHTSVLRRLDLRLESVSRLEPDAEQLTQLNNPCCCIKVGQWGSNRG